jgi:hypothetical protein
MRKMRDDSTWNRLTSEQLEQLDEWLFEERLGYADALARAEKEFGLVASLSSMGRYYRRRAREQQKLEVSQAEVMAGELIDLPVSTDNLRKAAVKLVGKIVLKLAVAKPEQVEQVVFLTKLLLASEENDLRRERLKLARQYFHFEATAASLDELPKIRAYLDVIATNDAGLSHDEQIKRVKMILFGWKNYKSDEAEPDKSKNGN